MIYLIHVLSHFLEILFPFCYAVSIFSATPYMLSSTMMREKVMSSEMTYVDRPLKTSALLAHLKAIFWTLGCMGENMDIFFLSRQDTVTRLCECWRYHQEGFLSCVNGSLASRLRHITICNTKFAVNSVNSS